MKGKNLVLTVVIGLLITGCGFFVIPYLVTQYIGAWVYDQDSAFIGDTLGGIVGPIIGLFGVILTFIAFYIQYVANNDQRKALFIDQFESKFFELLRMHRENLNTIRYEEETGLYAVKKLSLELQHCLTKLIKLNENRLSDKKIIDVGFYFFYNGIDNTTKNKITKDVLVSDEDENAGLLKLMFRELDTWKKESGSKVITDQESRVEIYFKHIYHMVSFLDNQKSKLTTDEYKFFSDTIIAQLTTYEVNMLLYYAISEIGNHWFNPINFVKEYDLLSKIKEDSKGIDRDSLKLIIEEYEKSI
jgi:hypothetical protein